MNRQTYLAKNNEVAQAWHVVDATDQVMGRLSTRLAVILMGKHKPQYTPHHDVGDYIIVTNVEKMKMTGSKLDQKFFQRYSHYPGGQNNVSYRRMMERRPQLLLERSVRRMLPKNRLASGQLAKLKIYQGPDHPHQAQQPQALAL